MAVDRQMPVCAWCRNWRTDDLAEHGSCKVMRKETGAQDECEVPLSFDAIENLDTRATHHE